jgi:hypothetical protein
MVKRGSWCRVCLGGRDSRKKGNRMSRERAKRSEVSGKGLERDGVFV